MLVLLMTAVTGAWAQEQSETIATTDKNIVEGTHFTISNNGSYADEYGMNADGGITVTAKNGETITKVVISCTYYPEEVNDGNTSVSSGTKEITNDGGTITVTGVNASTFTFTCSNTGPQFCQFVVYYTEAPAGYSVTMPQDTPDATLWTAKAGTDGTYQQLPLEGVAAGTAVTVKYSGTKKVKSVKAVKKAAAAPAGTDLSTINANYTASNGETLTGTLANNVKISIADGATVILNGVNITNLGNNCDWAGINCLGDATIILSGTNTVSAGIDGSGLNNYPGIYVPSGSMLTIQGDGSLTAYSVSDPDISGGAGIGGGFQIGCGDIVIAGGTITATGGSFAAAIGGAQEGDCGNITISDGTITATGGSWAPAIGGGLSSTCGTITITDGVTSVTATKDATYPGPNSIGAGDNGTCGTVTIGGVVGAITTSPYTYTPSN